MFVIVVVRCEAPMKPDNGNMSVSGYYYGAVVKFWCLSGYELAGNDSAACQQTGSWSSPSPNCLSLSGYQRSFRTFYRHHRRRRCCCCCCCTYQSFHINDLQVKPITEIAHNRVKQFAGNNYPNRLLASLASSRNCLQGPRLFSFLYFL